MKKRIEYDASEKGLRAVLKDYQEIALRVIWESPEGLGSRAVWDRVNAGLKPGTISRASVINFLEEFREAWRQIYGGWDPDEEVVVYEFKLLENRNQAKLNGLNSKKDG